MAKEKIVIDLSPELVTQTLFREVREARDAASKDAEEAGNEGIERAGFLGIDFSDAEDIKDTVCGLREEAERAIGFLSWIPFGRAYIAALIGAYRMVDKLVLSKVCEAEKTGGPVVVRNFNN